MYLHLSIIQFYHLMVVTLRTHCWPFRFYQIWWKKLVRNYQKKRKKRSKSSKLSDINYFLTKYVFTKNTQKCANCVDALIVLRFFISLFLVFQIFTFQWLECTVLKDELNWSYNGGGVVYLLKSVAINFNLTVRVIYPDFVVTENR